MAREKIVVLGGGCGAMAAAFALTDRAGWQDKYEITLYQPGWRLGGKGAAGRNAQSGNRIEEHGLHVWSGFYENAFWMMRKCYAELDRPATHPLATAFTAFRPRHYAGLSNLVGGEWEFWKGYLPHASGLPGDFIDPGEYRALADIRSPWDMLCDVVVWSLRYIETTTDTASGHEPEPPGEAAWLINLILSTKPPPQGFWPRVKALLRLGLIGLILFRLLKAFRAARRYHDGAGTAPPGTAPQSHTDKPYVRLADRVACLQWWIHRQLGRPATEISDKRSFFLLADLFTTMMIGMLRDGVITKGFDAIDGKDLRAWLGGHGALAESLANPTVDSAYSYVFAFEEGDPARPNLEAGVAVRLLLRLLLCSRGAVFWEMQGGMGDTIFAPLYQALVKRGVRFKFFHRAEALESADGKAVDRIVIGRQATLKPGLGDYAPLVTVAGLPGWPSCPDYSQLVEGEELRAKYAGRLCELESNYADWEDRERITLEAGVDFDRVVLGISVEAVKFICADLSAKNARFKQGVEGIKTTRTQSMQLWTERGLSDLGWHLPPPIVCSYGEPFDTWADMSGLLEREAWPGPDFPRSIAYFCGAMKDDARGILPPGPQPGYLQAQHEQVKDNARNWLAQYTGELWPDGTRPGSPDLDYQVLHRDGGGSDKERFDAQWFSANVDLASRYVLSLPGTTRYRLRAGDSGFANLVLAGDWVRNGLNYGCVESAVLGGFQAARAICGYPGYLFGETDGIQPLPPDDAPPDKPPVPPPAPVFADTYIRRGGMDVLPAPWRCDDVQVDAFYLEADLDALQALCTRCLKDPSHGFLDFRPATAFVALTFQRLTGLRSLAKGCTDAGAHNYCEAAIWIFVQRYDAAGKPAGAAVLMIPYIFAEDGLAVATGREAYGYPKEHATVSMPLRSAPADNYSVRALAVPHYGPSAQALPDTEILRCTLIDASARDGQAHALREIGEDLLRAALDGRIGETPLALVEEAVIAMLGQRIDLVFLREFRALAGGGGSNLQAVTSASQSPFELKSLRVLPGVYELTLPPLDSHPIAADLGLKVRDGNKVDVLLGAEFDFSFTLTPARTLWPPQSA